MYRKIMSFLEVWKDSEHRKPLILQGARQVGKTYSILEFGRTCYENVAYFNFETNPKLNENFDENISLIGTGKHELFTNLHEFLESFKFDVKRRGKIRLEVRNLHQEEERLDDDHVLAHGTVDFTGLFKDGSICFKMETRFTIIYKWTNGKWLVQHLHHSTPDLEQMDGEEFPLALGKQVKKTRQALHALGTAYYHISCLLYTSDAADE